MLRYWQKKVKCPECSHQWTSDMSNLDNLRKVDFFWINKDMKSFEWFIELLSQLEIEQAEKGGAMERFLDMHLYLTSAKQKTDMRALGLQLALDLLHVKVSSDAWCFFYIFQLSLPRRKNEIWSLDWSSEPMLDDQTGAKFSLSSKDRTKARWPSSFVGIQELPMNLSWSVLNFILTLEKKSSKTCYLEFLKSFLKSFFQWLFKNTIFCQNLFLLLKGDSLKLGPHDKENPGKTQDISWFLSTIILLLRRPVSSLITHIM